MAKAIVAGLVSFATGLAAAAIALPVGERMLREGGIFIDPVSTLARVQLVAGTAALFAVAAVLALALGALLRRSGVAVTAVILMIVVPQVLGTVISGSALAWPSAWLCSCYAAGTRERAGLCEWSSVLYLALIRSTGKLYAVV